jgi:hypothetical protein
MDATPFERFFGSKPDLSHLRVFGSLGYALIPQQFRRKLDPTAEECWLVGYEPGGAYRVLLQGGAVLVKRDVTWDESVVYKHRHRQEAGPGGPDPDGGALDAVVGGAPGAHAVVEPAAPMPEQPTPIVQAVQSGGHAKSADELVPGDAVSAGDADSSVSGEFESALSGGEQGGESPAAVGVEQPMQPTGPGPPAAPPRREGLRDRGKLEPIHRFTYDEGHRAVLVVSGDDPKTYAEAMASPAADLWRQAMEGELASHHEMGSFEVVQKPHGVRVLPTMWVFARKLDAQGRVERYKARLVIQGNRQVAGVDFDEVFAPVSRFATLRVFLAMVAREDMELHQLDVKTAFLNADLDRDVYAYPAQGSGVPRDKVLLLKRAVYGLRQAPRAWFERLKEHLVSFGFEPSSADPSLYVLNKDGVRSYLLVYVDDLLAASVSLEMVQEVKRHIMSEFAARDMGEASTFLGYEISRDRAKRELIIRQSGLVREYAVKFGAERVKKRRVPIPAGTVLQVKQDKSPPPPRYSELLGSLLYLAGGTRPDISFAVGALSRFSSNPSMQHWRVLKGVLNYVAGTPNAGIRFDGMSASGLEGYSDSDYAADKVRRKSVSGSVFTICGGAVVWLSKQQTSVALSTAEAEYTAAAQASKEGLWLRNLMIDLGEPPMSVPLHMDNQAAIAMTENPVVSTKCKHVDVHLHAVRDYVAQGLLAVQYTRTEEMAADMLTKVVSPHQHMMCCGAVGMVGL